MTRAPVKLATLRPKIGGARFCEYQPNGAWTLSAHVESTGLGMRDGNDATYEATVVGFDSAHFSYSYALGRFGDTDDFIGFDMDVDEAVLRASVASIDFLRSRWSGKWDGAGGFANAGCFILPCMDVAGNGTNTGLGSSWDTIRSGWSVANHTLIADPVNAAPAFLQSAGYWLTATLSDFYLDMPYQVAKNDLACDPGTVTWTVDDLLNRSMGIHIGPFGIGQLANKCLCSEFSYEVWGQPLPGFGELVYPVKRDPTPDFIRRQKDRIR